MVHRPGTTLHLVELFVIVTKDVDAHTLLDIPFSFGHANSARLKYGLMTVGYLRNSRIVDSETNVNHLEILYNQLIKKIDSLKIADNELLNVIEAKDIEKEVDQAESYMENLISYKCKISQRIGSLTPPIVPPVVYNSTNVPISTTQAAFQEPKPAIKLPKLTVNKILRGSQKLVRVPQPI
ncbi:hypothetical protein AVEN_231915-1 [Araneus ventricosus]|uniref:Uncharacterized protein n=1 Tax=Araneus ventricosus TaxID=182803 RepID=A0A4Y2SB96_ARAVE|nr:hypothetical protein AVEN_231915-1 [Araneus ventricosus]